MGVLVFRSIVVAFAAFLMLGQARDRTELSEPTSERDSASRKDVQMEAEWAVRTRRQNNHGPVSEL